MPCQRALFLLLLIVLTTLPSFSAATKRFTVEEDIRLVHFGDPYTHEAEPIEFSPNGAYFAVDTERGVLHRNRPESTLRVYRTNDAHFFLLHSGQRPAPIWELTKSTYKDGPIISHIRWLEDSSGIAFLMKTASGNDQLFLANLKTRLLQSISSRDQQVTAFDVADQSHIVYSALSPLIGEEAASESHATSVVGTGRTFPDLMFPKDRYLVRHQHDLSELWALRNEKRFRVEDRSCHEPFFVHSGGQRVLALSPNGRFVLTALPIKVVPPEWDALFRPKWASYPRQLRAGVQDNRAFNGFFFVNQYVLIDLAEGTAKLLTGTPVANEVGWWDSHARAAWSADSAFVVLPSTFLPAALHKSDSLPNRPCIMVANVREHSLACLDWLKGPTQNGYDKDFRFVEAIHFIDRPGRKIVVDYRQLNGTKDSVGYFLSANGQWTKSWANQQEKLGNGSIAVFVKQGLNDPPVLVGIDRDTNKSDVIWDPNPQLAQIRLGDAKVLNFTDSDGHEWSAGLYRPPDYDGTKRYPLVIQSHGFIQDRFDPSGVFPTAFAARELSDAGILVLQVPDCPLFGTPSESACNVQRYKQGIDRLVAEGTVDPERLGIVGFSRTCLYVMHALTTNIIHFAAASITDGVNEGYLQYLASVDELNNVLAHDYDAMIGAQPFRDGLQQWFKNSPEFNMDKVSTPLLVVAKGRAGLLSMWEPYALLRYQNKAVDLTLLEESTHVLTNPAERLVSQGGTVDWFRFWLKNEEDPNPDKADQYIRWRKMRTLQHPRIALP